jgi:hypothetical protein
MQFNSKYGKIDIYANKKSPTGWQGLIIIILFQSVPEL